MFVAENRYFVFEIRILCYKILLSAAVENSGSVLSNHSDTAAAAKRLSATVLHTAHAYSCGIVIKSAGVLGCVRDELFHIEYVGRVRIEKKWYSKRGIENGPNTSRDWYIPRYVTRRADRYRPYRPGDRRSTVFRLSTVVYAPSTIYARV